MPGSFVIDAFPEAATIYRDLYTIVAVDVIRATTTAVTALEHGHRVFPVATVEEALLMAAEKPDALLVGEQNGFIPEGFDLTNSPCQVVGKISGKRSIILVSSSGTRLVCNAIGLTSVYVGCFRNLTALTSHLVSHHRKIALIGAGSKGSFRREDQMGCAYIGQRLLAAGYQAENLSTAQMVNKWSRVDHREAAFGDSADYLRKSGQTRDLEFILEHFDDLDLVPVIDKRELIHLGKASLPATDTEYHYPLERYI